MGVQGAFDSPALPGHARRGCRQVREADWRVGGVDELNSEGPATVEDLVGVSRCTGGRIEPGYVWRIDANAGLSGPARS
jgi:hypothetical protein